MNLTKKMRSEAHSATENIKAVDICRATSRDGNATEYVVALVIANDGKHYRLQPLADCLKGASKATAKGYNSYTRGFTATEAGAWKCATACKELAEELDKSLGMNAAKILEGEEPKSEREKVAPLEAMKKRIDKLAAAIGKLDEAAKTAALEYLAERAEEAKTAAK